MMGTRWQSLGNVWPEMHRLQDEMDRLLGWRSGTAQRRYSRAGFPPVNLWEDDDNLFVSAELPGLEIDDLELLVNGQNELSIKGERKEPEIGEGAWHRQERGFGSFSRLIELPHQVDADQVSAEFRQGVLTITLPKMAEARPRRIQVKAD